MRHAHHQCLQIRDDWWTARGLTLFGAVKLLRDGFAVPAEDRVRFDDGGHFRERLFTQCWSTEIKRHSYHYLVKILDIFFGQ